MDQSLTLQPTDYGLQPPQVILFDAVGTLIDACPPVAEVYWEAGRRYGSRHGLADIRQRFRASFARHCQPGQTSEVNR